MDGVIGRSGDSGLGIRDKFRWLRRSGEIRNLLGTTKTQFTRDGRLGVQPPYYMSAFLFIFACAKMKNENASVVVAHVELS